MEAHNVETEAYNYLLNAIQNLHSTDYAVVDLRRLPPAFFAPAVPAPVNGDALTAVVDKIEALTATMAEFGTRLQPAVEALSHLSLVNCQPGNAQNATTITPASVAVSHNTVADGEVSTGATALVADGEQQSNSWSKLAADLTGHEHALKHRKIRVGVKVGDCRIKSVPRQLTLSVPHFSDCVAK